MLAAICTLAAAALLLIGPVTTWADVSADPVVFAAVLGEDVGVIMPAIEDSTSDYTWLEANKDGEAAWVAGLALLVLAAVVALRATIVGGVVTAVLGVGCVWLAVANAPEARPLIAEAIGAIAGWAHAAGVDPTMLAPAYTVTRGPSVATVVAGGVVAIFGGIMTVVAVEPEGATSWVPWTDVRRDEAAAPPQEES